jgi:O-antigen/teichoic acid export membrane protein
MSEPPPTAEAGPSTGPAKASLAPLPTARRLGLTTVVLGASGTTTLVFNIVFARVLDPQDYGDLARTFSLSMAIAQLSMAGIAPAIARAVADAADDSQRLKRTRSAIRILALSSLLASSLYVPLAAAGLGSPHSVTLALGWAVALIYPIYFGIKAVLFALDRVGLYAILEIVSDVLFFGSLAVLAILAPTAALLPFAFAYGVFTVVSVALLQHRSAGRGRIPLDSRFWRYSVLASVATYASVVQFPAAVILTGVVGDSAQSAHIGAVLALVTPLFLLPQAGGMLVFAKVARARGAGEQAAIDELVRLVALTCAAIVCIALLFADSLIELLLGKEYEVAAPIFVTVVACLAPLLAATPVANAFAAEGRVGLNAAVSSCGLAVTVIGTVALVPAFDALGAAIAVGAASLLTGTLLLVLGRLRYDLPLSAMRMGGIVLVAVLAAAILLDPAPLTAALILAAGFTALALLVAVRSRTRPNALRVPRSFD